MGKNFKTQRTDFKVTWYGRAELGSCTSLLPAPPAPSRHGPYPLLPSQLPTLQRTAWLALCHLSSLCLSLAGTHRVGVLSFPPWLFTPDFFHGNWLWEEVTVRTFEDSEQYQISIIKCLVTQEEEVGKGRTGRGLSLSSVHFPVFSTF